MSIAPGNAENAEEEFERLFRAYHAVILAAAFNRVGDTGIAEDAAAEVFTAAWRRRREHAEVLTLRWLYATLRNVVGNEYRRQGRTRRRQARATAEYRIVVDTAGIGDEQIELRGLVASLGENDRELIWMAYWEDLSHAEMAVILGCTQAALRVRLLRARNRLKTLMKQKRILEQGALYD